MSLQLNQHSKFNKPEGPVVLVIADGVGVAPSGPSNAVTEAKTPNLDILCSGGSYRTLLAHGTHVGLPTDDDIGNSEVGHNAMGAGKIYDQGAKLINNAIVDGTMFQTGLWGQVVEQSKSATLHLLGLHSDGVVHSDIKHLHSILEGAAMSGITKIRIHSLLDGRDTPERSALSYIEQTESYIGELSTKYSTQDFSLDFKIVSGGGRMKITMDRYDADWQMVERGYNCHTHGVGRQFASAIEAVETMYSETDLGDQNLDAFVVVDRDQKPIGKISDGDVVLLYNYRGDRAIEISRAFSEPEFEEFDRGEHPDVLFLGMLQYDGDLSIPENYLVAPPKIEQTVSEYLCESGVKSFAVSETQKFGHVTYFWNGNKSGYINEELETYVEIPSDNVEFNSTPAMKAEEIADKVIELIESGIYGFGRLNFPNGDMVGHTGDLSATVEAMEFLDSQMGRLIEAVKNANGIIIYTADHGNADVMYKDKDGVRSAVTSHTLNPVPFAIANFGSESQCQLVENEDASLGNLAATILNLLGYEAPDDYLDSLISLS